MKLFQREQRSLFSEILDWMLTPMLLLWPISLMLTWLVAQGIAAKPFDRAMEAKLDTLARLVIQQSQEGKFPLSLPPRALLNAEGTDTVYYQVRHAHSGVHLGGEKGLPLPAETADNPATTQLRNVDYLGVDLRVAHKWIALPGPGSPQVLLQVAESKEKRSALATDIIRGVMLPQFVILPLAVLLVWLALTHAIKPLRQLENRIRARRADDLSPLNTEDVPLEVAPVVESVNDLLLRLKESIASQKRFLADAAHQLKTPLAGLRMQADLAQRASTDAEELKQSLRQIVHASKRATHTVNQLLALARAEGGGAIMTRQPCDLAELTVQVVRDYVPRALERYVDLGYEGFESKTPAGLLAGNPTLIQEMLRNLLDNAFNYTPSSPERPGVITVRLLKDAQTQGCVLQVEDSGPGIAASERELVFEPFYRSPLNPVEGSGLGLSIVMEIAHQHQAQVRIEDSHAGQQPPGTRVSVHFACNDRQAR